MATVAPVLVERIEIHKSCKSLESIVSVLANYTEAANALATIQKKLVKALKEAASVKGTDSVPANAMVNSAGIFEGLSEVDAKFAKIVDKEAEIIGNDLKKWFKKLAKEEKAHDERIASANARIKQAGQAYEKKAKRRDHDTADEHSRYLTVLNSVGPEMSKDKYNHALFVTQRHTATLSSLAASLSRLAEAEWIRACEIVRRSASSIGNVGQWRVLCEGGWSGPIPGGLPDSSNHDGPDSEKSLAGSARLIPSSTMAGTDIGPSLNATTEYPESPTNSSNSKLPSSTRKSGESHSGVEHSGSYPTPSRAPSPPNARENVQNKYSNTEPDQEMAATKPVVEPGSSTISPPNATASLGTSSEPNVSSAKNNGINSLVDADSTPQERRQSVQPDHSSGDIFNLETKAIHTPLFEDSLSFLPNHESAPMESPQSNAPKKLNVGFLDERELQINTPFEDTKLSGGRNKSMGNLGRRLSVESTNSLVATMKERYDTRQVQSPLPPSRDLPRLTQRVTDLATRYTPIETPTSPRSENSQAVSPKSGLSGDRFPTFQDRYLRTDRDKNRFKLSPGSVPDRDYFDDRDRERYRPSETPTVDRNHFLRDDRDRERYHLTRPLSPDRQHIDEPGMRDRQRRFEIFDEAGLQEREAKLRERERQLEIERARLANAREGGYTSDTSRGRGGTSPYGGLRRSESPGPMGSQQSLRPSQTLTPYDHSPNCGCQRCSAQHYASTPSLPRTRRTSGAVPEPSPIYKPDPPILLRPEKPKNWIRRLSMPVPSLGSTNDKKGPVGLSSSGQLGGGNMRLPDEDGRIRRRSFELEQDRNARGFGGTTR